MTLTEAVHSITVDFPRGADDATPADTHVITSGGPVKGKVTEPALWASQDLAVTAFQREAIAYLKAQNATAIQFIDGPHLDKWNITVMDSKGMQRTAEPRWSVTAKVGLDRAGSADDAARSEERAITTG